MAIVPIRQSGVGCTLRNSTSPPIRRTRDSHMSAECLLLYPWKVSDVSLKRGTPFTETAVPELKDRGFTL